MGGFLPGEEAPRRQGEGGLLPSWGRRRRRENQKLKNKSVWAFGGRSLEAGKMKRDFDVEIIVISSSIIIIRKREIEIGPAPKNSKNTLSNVIIIIKLGFYVEAVTLVSLL